MHIHKTDQHCWSNKSCDFMITRTLISLPIIVCEGCQCVITDYKESRQDTRINFRTCEVYAGLLHTILARNYKIVV